MARVGAIGCLQHWRERWGLAIVLVRPPLPIDETRYLEILRENLAENPLLLTLDGVPYADKPPLLFWLGSLLAKLGLPWAFALRSIPALASALTILFVARIGRRAGLELTGWMQSALLLPFAALQLLLFDPLLTCAIWGTIDAWTRARTLPSLAWCSAAFLAKGPVALLFLVPFLWSCAPLRPPGSRSARVAAVLLVPSVLPLVAWAVLASALGGPEFARALLWDRWAGRMVHSFAHDRPAYFYALVALAGFLPGTPLFACRGSSRPLWARRTVLALAAILVILTLMSGKQAHYLLPAAPAVALLAAWSVERTVDGPRALRRGIQLELSLLILLVALAVVRLGDMRGFTGQSGLQYLRSGAWKPVILGSLLALGLGLLIASSRRCSLTQVLAGLVLALGAASLGVHRIAGELLYPHALAAALRVDPGVPLAHLGPAKHGIFELLSGRSDILKLRDANDLCRWSEEHPGGLIVVDRASLEGALPPEWEVTVFDVVHRSPVLVLRSVWADRVPH